MAQPLVSLRTEGTKIQIVNQLLLPHQVEWITINSVEEAHDAIKTMKIRGAPAIASLAALSIASHLAVSLDNEDGTCYTYLQYPDELKAHVQPKLDYLYTARPTAVNLGAAMRRLTKVLDDGAKNGMKGMDLAQEVVDEAWRIHDEDIGRNKEMAKHGGEWLFKETAQRRDGQPSGGLNVMTVCNTGSLATSGYGTALGLITYLHETGKLQRAFYTQSTPYHQGSRLTSLELKTLNIPSTMLCDSMVGSLFQHKRIHGIVVGADRIAANGDTANKIGTYNAAVLAARHKIPFIVVAPISTVDLEISDGSKIPIEHRPDIEAQCARGALYPVNSENPEIATVLITPQNLDGVYNPSFDVTPAELITAIVTEKGVAVKAPGASVFDLSSVV